MGLAWDKINYVYTTTVLPRATFANAKITIQNSVIFSEPLVFKLGMVDYNVKRNGFLGITC